MCVEHPSISLKETSGGFQLPGLEDMHASRGRTHCTCVDPPNEPEVSAPRRASWVKRISHLNHLMGPSKMHRPKKPFPTLHTSGRTSASTAPGIMGKTHLTPQSPDTEGFPHKELVADAVPTLETSDVSGSQQKVEDEENSKKRPQTSTHPVENPARFARFRQHVVEVSAQKLRGQYVTVYI